MFGKKFGQKKKKEKFGKQKWGDKIIEEKKKTKFFCLNILQQIKYLKNFLIRKMKKKEEGKKQRTEMYYSSQKTVTVFRFFSLHWILILAM